MAVTLVGSQTATSNTLTIPAHQAGDIIVSYAYVSITTSIPIPTGNNWESVSTSTDATTSVSQVMATKKAISSSESFGTWTGATRVAVAVFRGSDGVGGIVSPYFVNGTALNWRIPTAQKRADGTSWIVRFAGSESATNLRTTGAPSEATVQPGASNLAVVYTQANVTSSTSLIATTASPSTRAGTMGVEIIIIDLLPTTQLDTLDGRLFDKGGISLEATATDPEGQRVHYEINIEGITGSSSVTFNSSIFPNYGWLNTVNPANLLPFNSGEKASFTLNNNDVYLFDASQGIEDNNAYTNPAFAFQMPYTSATTKAASHTSTATAGYLGGKGTNAPGDRQDKILSVRVRSSGNRGVVATWVTILLYGVQIVTQASTNAVFTDSGGGVGWVNIPAPSGGWTWQKIKDLEVRYHMNGGPYANVLYRTAQVHVQSEHLLDYGEYKWRSRARAVFPSYSVAGEWAPYRNFTVKYPGDFLSFM